MRTTLRSEIRWQWFNIILNLSGMVATVALIITSLVTLNVAYVLAGVVLCALGYWHVGYANKCAVAVEERLARIREGYGNKDDLEWLK